jgi:uncharacterized membrane protein
MSARIDAHPRHAPTDELAPRADRHDDRVGASAWRRQPPGVVLVALVVVGGFVRVWHLGVTILSFDESFTAMIGRRGVGSAVDYLRHFDSHPPLDYLLRMPLAAAGVSNAVLRLPSAIMSLAALGLFAWWMRTRGWFGVIAVATLALAPNAVGHGREARMYALLQLVGIAAVWAADQWQRSPRRWQRAVLFVAVGLAVFDHIAGLMLALGLFVVPGRRRDREAWRYRAAVAAPVACWAAVWGPTFLHQATRRHTSAPTGELRALVEAVGGQLTSAYSFQLFTTIVIIAGGACLLRSEPALARCFGACFALPAVAAAGVGFVAVPILLPKLLSFAVWAPPLAVAALVQTATKRGAMVGAAVTILLVAVVVPPTLSQLDNRSVAEAVMADLAHRARPGDVLAVRPAWLAPLIEWNIGVQGAGVGATTPTGFPDTHAFVLGHRASTGRVWLLEPVEQRADASAWRACAPERVVVAVERLRCLERPS